MTAVPECPFCHVDGTEPNLLALVCITAYELYLSTLVGDPTPGQRALSEELRNPRPGDLVIETSTIHHRDRDRQRFGRLLRTFQKPVYTAEKWREGGGRDDEPIPTDLATVIAPIHGGEFEWTNAEFVKVKTAITWPWHVRQ